MALVALAVALVAVLAVLADGFWQTRSIGRGLERAFHLLQSARSDLLSGNVQRGGAVDAALLQVQELELQLQASRFSMDLFSHLPLLGRTEEAARLGVEAADQGARALFIARGIVRDLGSGSGAGAAGGLIEGGRVNIGLIAALAPRAADGIEHLQTAVRDLRAIPHIPLFGWTAQVQRAALADGRDAIRTAQRALAGIRLLPSFLGADGPRTYLLAFQNNADLRATGGALLAYGIVRMDAGRIELLRKGGVTSLDHNRPIPVPSPQPIRWYLRATRRPNFIDNGPNYTPDFPVVAATWAQQVRKAAGISLDGVIALDPQTVADALSGQPALSVPAYPDPITSANVADVVENLQYLLPPETQKVLPGQLIRAAFQALTAPRDVVALARSLGTALTEKRVQLWSADPEQETLLASLGWDGALRPGRGDYLFLVREKRNAGKVDYYTRQEMRYTVRLRPDGAADVTLEVFLVNDTPPGLPDPIVGSWVPYGLNVQMVNAYVPERARFQSVDPAGPIHFRTRPRYFRQHVEGGRVRVFTKIVETWPGQPADLRIHYLVPAAAQRTGNRFRYSLTLQHQPLVQAPDITVEVDLPSGAAVVAADPGWSVKGDVALYGATLDRDSTIGLTYSLP